MADEDLDNMSPGDELLAVRERTVERGVPWFDDHVPHLSAGAYWKLRGGLLSNIGLRDWLHSHKPSLLEVVVVIEDAAVEALKEEGKLRHG